MYSPRPDSAPTFQPLPGNLWDEEDRAAIRADFLRWWHRTQECLIATLNLYRRFEDDDITALYIATWWGALEEVRDWGEVEDEKSINAAMRRLDVARLSGMTLVQLSELTGIPRETARRKLKRANELLIIEQFGEARFRLCAFSADIMPLFDNCIALADATLGCLHKPRTRQVADLSVGSWICLMQDFFQVMTTFWSVRRSLTRGASAVSVQVAIELVTTLKMLRLVGARGASLTVDLVTALALAPECHRTPYFLAQVAAMVHLDLVRVRRMCRHLSEHKRIEFTGADTIRPTPSTNLFSGQFPGGMFSLALRDAGLRFIQTAVSVLVAPPATLKGMPAHA